MAAPSSPEQPFQVSFISQSVREWVGRLGAAWIEGELTSYDVRGGHAYAKLRDLNEDASVSLTMWRSVRERLDGEFKKGDRVIVNAKPDFWVKGGTLSFQVYDMRQAGVGTLLEQLEKLRRKLTAEGLFAPELKKPLPFLPQKIGLITGRESDAEKDVRRNAELRWPAVEFRTIHTRVQGDNTVPEVIAAIQALDADPEVDVIIIARGGGDFLHLLPFSDEALVRAAASAHTPIVSAIGHEADRPLLDEVADLRASTPTDAAKRVVPDVAEQLNLVEQARARIRRNVTEKIRVETQYFESLRSRPAIANPVWMVDQRGEDLMRLTARGVELVERRLDYAADVTKSLRLRLNSLSPLGTLQRGYSIVEKIEEGSASVVTATDQVAPNTKLSIRVTDGRIEATVE
ncbi:exodeoxyribonuclease VII large subunit [Gulosibacter molinativorax]|uniref:Exodeoxyribonuclease 7 large subunit n=1 Tax=Gulosibacter molinativorax TaxID=256821 RepID=A0ABT7C7R9_9MICO|nr:exodeoxyribonuclease VII large subunit [Gulosibacter molinativorax]MDJ1370799.1 exodeoxyribonuclease VII large subunit [Gulosibacter molinativorax]